MDNLKSAYDQQKVFIARANRAAVYSIQNGDDRSRSFTDLAPSSYPNGSINIHIRKGSAFEEELIALLLRYCQG